MLNQLVAFVDGGGEWQDKPANIGLYIVDDHQNVRVEEGHIIGKASNNEAEYTAVLMAIYHAQKLGATDLHVYSDSKLIVNQINGDWKIHENHLRHYYDEVKREAESLNFTISWIPRAQNNKADKLARSAK